VPPIEKRSVVVSVASASRTTWLNVKAPVRKAKPRVSSSSKKLRARVIRPITTLGSRVTVADCSIGCCRNRKEMPSPQLPY
jgi:hypothetical protein